MATMTLHVSDQLLAELRASAEASGKSVDEVAEEVLRLGLEDRAWRDLLTYGRETARTLGLVEEDVPRLVKEWRYEQRSR